MNNKILHYINEQAFKEEYETLQMILGNIEQSDQEGDQMVSVRIFLAVFLMNYQSYPLQCIKSSAVFQCPSKSLNNFYPGDCLNV